MSINEVLFESRGVEHEDSRRTILTVFNGDLKYPNGDLKKFSAKQVKILDIKTNETLGGHWHDYDELYYLLEGKGKFILKDIETEVTQTYNMNKGDRLFIPGRIAHKAILEPEAILIGCTSEPYLSPEQNGHKYEF